MGQTPAADRIKRLVKSVPLIGPTASKLSSALRPDRRFAGSAAYWEQRYRNGGHSGSGSYNRLAEFKAEVLNEFVRRNSVNFVIEFGSGDGNQLRYADYPRYLGFDISAAAVDRCRRMFASDSTKRFLTMEDYAGDRADMTLSLDVIYHLVEDVVFDRHMRALFNSAERFVGIYSSNDPGLNHRLGGNRESGGSHERHRRFTEWIDAKATGWKLMEHRPNRYSYDPRDPANTSLAEFFFYARAQTLRA